MAFFFFTFFLLFYIADLKYNTQAVHSRDTHWLPPSLPPHTPLPQQHTHTLHECAYLTVLLYTFSYKNDKDYSPPVETTGFLAVKDKEHYNFSATSWELSYFCGC